MLVDADMEIVMSLCEVCPSQDTTGVAEILLICFESRTKVVPLLKAVVQKEIALTGTLPWIHMHRMPVDLFFFS